MSALLIESFDSVSSAFQLAESGFVSVGTPTFQTGRFGRGQRVTLPSATENLSFSVVATTEFFFGASIYLTQLNNTQETLFSFYDNAGSVTQMSVAVDRSGRLKVYTGATLLGTASGEALRVGSHNYVELHGVISNAAGSWDLLVNGTSVSSGSSVDTQQGANATFTHLYLHGNANTLTSFDDLYLNDNAGAAPYNTNLGPHELLTRRPDGDGYLTEWTPTGAGTSNADRVDDAGGHDDDVTYVNPTLAGDIDSYTYENIAAVFASGADTIHSVQYKTVARGDSGTYRARIRSVAADELGSSVSYPAVYGVSRHQSLTDPNTGLAWVSSAWDAAEAGVELIGL